MASSEPSEKTSGEVAAVVEGQSQPQQSAAATTPANTNHDTISPVPSPNDPSTKASHPIPNPDADVQSSSAQLPNRPDPLQFGRHRRHDTSKKQIRRDHPNASNPRKVRKFYTRQNQLIDQFLNVDDEERLKVEEDEKNAGKVKFAIWASFVLNLALFLIQLYAAVSTGSLALFATATDAFMDFVSSLVMLTTSRMAARPSIYKYPVGRTRIETIGVILFCCLMTTVAVQLLIESGRRLAEGDQGSESLHIVPLVLIAVAIFTKGSLMVYCLFYRQYPSVHVFYIDHRNDIAVNSFGLIMAVVGNKFVWYLDPVGAILIALLILFSWVSNAFEQVWLLVGKSAPRDYISKLVYMSMCHDERIVKVETCRAYHAGQNYYVEIDIVMDEETPLRVSHDVAQALQRKVEGLGDVERAFVHVDYEDSHDPHEEHKPLFEKKEKKPKRTLKEILMRTKKETSTGSEGVVATEASS
ncbi:cation efflux family protein [Sarocladium implicatum]|nr:cation efflux family protein [Sarocladium implicatum]